MDNFLKLVKGELYRLFKYKIFIVGIVVSALWALVIGLSDYNSAINLVPLLVGMDTAMMSIILIASSFYFEKQENTMKSILIAPVTSSMVLTAKIVGSVMISIISTLVVAITAIVIHQIEFNFFLLLFYVLIITISHIAIGLIIIFHSKDFGNMLGKYVLFFLVSYLPSILLSINVIPDSFTDVLLILPTNDAQVLLNSIFTTSAINYSPIIISIVYLSLLSIGLYYLVIYKTFKRYAIGG